MQTEQPAIEREEFGNVQFSRKALCSTSQFQNGTVENKKYNTAYEYGHLCKGNGAPLYRCRNQGQHRAFVNISGN